MTTATAKLVNVCTGGGHLRLDAYVNGVLKHTINTDINYMQEPLTEDELAAFVKVLVKLDKIGKTWAQVKTDFQSGITVTL